MTEHDQSQSTSNVGGADVAGVTIDDPWLRRFSAWAKQRFPLEQGVLLLPLYLASLAVGHFATGTSVAIGVWQVAGFFAFWSFFFVVRVFDEHKDYQIDCKNHPERVLQRGIITLAQLRVAAGIAIVAQIAIVSWICIASDSWTVFWTWAVAFVWSLGMAKEFFLHDWLSPRLVPYAISHMLLMPMLAYWAMSIGVATTATGFPTGTLPPLFAALTFLGGFTFELSRKLKAPEEERETVDSYSKVWGSKGAAVIVVCLMAAATAVLIAIFTTLFTGLTTLWWSIGALIVCAIGTSPLLSFARYVRTGAEKKLQTGAALFLLGTYSLTAAATIAAGGLQWTF